MQKVIILDFGGQYKELIARRVRECGTYSVIIDGEISAEELKKEAPIGVILTGGPNSVYAADSPKCDPEIFNLGIPVLGICYGCQLVAYTLGGRVESCSVSEYGRTNAKISPESPLFTSLTENQVVLMSHTDYVADLPAGFSVMGTTEFCPAAAFGDVERKIYGVQFHPEVENTPNGTKMIGNFLKNVCGAVGDYSMDDYLKRTIASVREQVGDSRVLLGLSGGVDSSVCAALLSEAIGEKLVCIYIDHGFMRAGETDEIKAAFANRKLNFVPIDASESYFRRLKGVTDPEEKRHIIGDEFVRSFEAAAAQVGNPEFLAQGTIYPDIVESGKNKKSAVIKSHHNVGGLPEKMNFKGVVEPLSHLFKDEVRRLGVMLGLPATLVNRQPFPGPGLAVRVIGEVTREKCDILRQADMIFRSELEQYREKSDEAKADQYFAVLTDTRSVGVKGDFRTYGYTVALRAVKTSDFMTCRIARLPYELIETVASRIANEVDGVGRVVYDITGKPPATIEWE